MVIQEHSGPKEFFTSDNIHFTQYVRLCLETGIQNTTKMLVCQLVFQKVAFSNISGNISMDNVLLFLNYAKIIILSGNDVQESVLNMIHTIWKFLPLGDNSWLPIPNSKKKNTVLYFE